MEEKASAQSNVLKNGKDDMTSNDKRDGDKTNIGDQGEENDSNWNEHGHDKDIRIGDHFNKQSKIVYKRKKKSIDGQVVEGKDSKEAVLHELDIETSFKNKHSNGKNLAPILDFDTKNIGYDEDAQLVTSKKYANIGDLWRYSPTSLLKLRIDYITQYI